MGAKEREAVRTTIVGGRPPGAGRNNLAVPRGIEVLVKKASVDPVFRELLLDQRAAAAKDIGLDLDLAETAMLGSVPRPQLVQIIEQTTVPDEQRRAFLGKVAMAMLAAIGAGLAGCTEHAEPAGIRPNTNVSEGVSPDRPLQTKGIQPDRPASGPTNSPAPTNAPPGPVSQGVPPDSQLRFKTWGIQPDRP